MARSARLRAESQFAATQKKKDKQVLKDREIAEKKRADHRAYLRGLRLAKEAADKEAADKEGTAKKTGKSGTAAGDSEMPQAHRRSS